MLMGGLKNRCVFSVLTTPPFDSSFSGCWKMEVVGFVRGGGGFCSFGFSWGAGAGAPLENP